MIKNYVHKTHLALLNRLKRAEGHLRKVIAMLQEGVSCVTVAQQLHGVHTIRIFIRRNANTSGWR